MPADSVRAVAAALGIDAATLPPRPVSAGMPPAGDTDPHWRDLACRLAEAGERILSSEPADAGRYRAAAGARRPAETDGHEPFRRAVAAMRPDFEVWLVLAMLVLAAAALAARAAGLADVRHLAADPAFPVAALALCSAVVAAPFARAWALDGPVRRHDRRVAAMARRLDAQRYVVTDRAAYVVDRATDGRRSWRRLALPAATSSRRPVDGLAPEVGTLALGDGAGAVLDLLAPMAGGEVEASLAVPG